MSDRFYPYLQLGKTFDGLERPQHPQDPQGLDGVDVLAFCPSVQMESTVRTRPWWPDEEQQRDFDPVGRRPSIPAGILLVEAMHKIGFLSCTEACNCGDDFIFRVVPVHLLQYRSPSAACDPCLLT